MIQLILCDTCVVIDFINLLIIYSYQMQLLQLVL